VSNRAAAQGLNALPPNTRGHQCQISGAACTFSSTTCDPRQGATFGQGAGCECGVGDTCVACSAPAPAAPWVCDALPVFPQFNLGNNNFGGAEGTAMMELVHDMAPQANMIFVAVNGGGPQAFADGVTWLQQLGADTIVEDLRFDTEPAFDRGQVALSIDNAMAGNANLTFHSSSGNRGQQHGPRVLATGTGNGPDGTVFTGVGCGTAPAPNNLVNISLGPSVANPALTLPPVNVADNTLDMTYAPGANLTCQNSGLPCTVSAATCPGANCECGAMDVCVAPTVVINLQWSEPRTSIAVPSGGGFTDLDLYVLDPTGKQCLIAPAINNQGGGNGNTLEQLVLGGPVTATNAIAPNTRIKVAVNVKNAPAGLPVPMLDLRVSNGNLRMGTVGLNPPEDQFAQLGSLDPNSNLAADAAFNVGASGNANQGGVNDSLNAFSGSGPIHIGSSSVCPPGGYPCAGTAAGLCQGNLGQVCTFSAATCPGVGCECGAAGVCLAGPTVPPSNNVAHVAFVGRDNVVVSGSGGFGSPFTGTSAACPQTAACDALVRSVFGVGSSRAVVTGRLYDSPFPLGVIGNGPAATLANMTGVGVLNCYEALDPPTALCQDVEVPADASCQGSVTAAQIDNGSFDNQGGVTPSLDTTGPFPLSPPSDVKLTVLDSDGLVNQVECAAVVTVKDETPPEFVDSELDPVVETRCDFGETSITLVAPETTDNCEAEGPVTVTGAVTASSNPAVTVPLEFDAGETISLPPGVYTVTWDATDAAGNPSTTSLEQSVTVQPALFATDSIFVRENGSQVRLPGGGFASVANSGDGIVDIKNDAAVGDIQSVANVAIGHRAIAGNIVSENSIFWDTQIAVADQPEIESETIGPVSLPPAFDLSSVVFPNTPGEEYVDPGEDPVLTPGNYGAYTVNSGGVLTLLAGTYFFEELTINSEGTVVATEETVLFIKQSDQFQGPIEDSAGDLVSVFIGFDGPLLNLSYDFVGTIVAPNGTVHMGTAQAQDFSGVIHAQTIDLANAADFTCLELPCTSEICGGPTELPEPTCEDEAQNGDEEGVDCGGSCPDPCPACNEQTYQAESITQSTGGPFGMDAWNIFSNGFIEAEHDFTAGPATITVSALGQQAFGVLPHMVVTVGGVAVGSANVLTSGFNDYTFVFTAAGGPEDIRVIFDNDLYIPPADRNLIVDSFTVGCDEP
jgi:hypothetical protein